ncbi:hypothetical protein GCM10025857_09700 [Alicyclobacillus contaminans]|uniref:TrmB family transcriptional regulator n=1 Tax=Alicyclobacillus contaminans TaxID=392016 RepID=UPI000405B7A7|nr:helix-turn-helix domain-containing protein [Alicyclobacillus contaminans]GMA49613.1 hypothetical protein GCM10025857_09700 [Alicyclobacillus contaminans]
MSALESLLQKAGFTDYEARAYVALLNKSPQTGYELAKTSRIPRGNIYSVLQKLEDRGAATRIAGRDVVKYAAVNPELVVRRMRTSFLATMDDVERQARHFAQTAAEEAIEVFDGYENLLWFAADAIERARERLRLVAHRQDAAALVERIGSLAGLPPRTTVCLSQCARDCALCGSDVRKITAPAPCDSRGLLVVADDTWCVAGDVGDAKVTGIRTSLPVLVRLAGAFVDQCVHSGAVPGALLQSVFARGSHRGGDDV